MPAAIFATIFTLGWFGGLLLLSVVAFVLGAACSPASMMGRNRFWLASLILLVAAFSIGVYLDLK